MSSILETFYILFKSNADDVDKGGKKATDTTEKLQDTLNDTTKDTKAVGEAFNVMMARAVTALASVLAVGTAIAAVNATVAQTQDLRLTSMETGDGVGQIDAMQRATRRFGGAVDETNGVIRSLNAAIQDTAFSGDGSLSPVLRRLGLNLRNSRGEIVKPIELLDKLNVAFQRVSKRESFNLGQKMGLSKAMISMLQQTPEAYNKSMEAAKKYGAVTAEQIEAVNKFDTTLNDMSTTLGIQVRNSVLWAIPTLQMFLDKVNAITAYLAEHKNLVVGFFTAIAAVVTTVYLPAMVRAAAATLAATWPILAIIAIVGALAAAFALLYDDVKTFFDGGDSMLGEAIKKWPILGKNLDVLVATLKGLVTVVQWASGFLIDLFLDPQKAASDLLALFSSLVEWVQAKFPGMAPIIEGLGDSFVAMGKIVMNVLQGIGDFLKLIMSGVSGGLEFITGKVKDFKAFFGINQSAQINQDMGSAQKALDFAGTTPIAPQTSSSIANTRMGNKSFEVTTGDIIIQTEATDADGISAAVGQTLTQHMRHAMYNIDDGVAG